jgi:hypothetical protein
VNWTFRGKRTVISVTKGIERGKRNPPLHKLMLVKVGFKASPKLSALKSGRRKRE